MSDVLYRAFEPDIEIKPRSKGGDPDGRTLYGIAVPWRKPVEIRSERIVEQFAPGAFRRQESDPSRVKLFREHHRSGGELIGRLDVIRNDDPAGLYVEAKVAETEDGDKVLALVRNGALNEWSIGFTPIQDRDIPMRSGESRPASVTRVVERVTAHMRELAVTLAGAYGELAAVAGVRSLEDDPVTRRAEEARQFLASLPELPPAV